MPRARSKTGNPLRALHPGSTFRRPGPTRGTADPRTHLRQRPRVRRRPRTRRARLVRGLTRITGLGLTRRGGPARWVRGGCPEIARPRPRTPLTPPAEALGLPPTSPATPAEPERTRSRPAPRPLRPTPQNRTAYQLVAADTDAKELVRLCRRVRGRGPHHRRQRRRRAMGNARAR